jgi:3-methyladenine DNA glycosylase/8-oxoguanine DNA glycosylase
VLRHDGALVPYEVRWSGPSEDVRSDDPRPGERPRSSAAVRRGPRLFGLDFDLPGFYRMAKADAALRAAGRAALRHAPDAGRRRRSRCSSARSPAQQVNLSFAFACRARLVRRYGTPVVCGRLEVWAFPDAAALARARVRTCAR